MDYTKSGQEDTLLVDAKQYPDNKADDEAKFDVSVDSFLIEILKQGF